MMLKDTIMEIAKSQKIQLNKQEIGITRELLKKIELNVPHAIIISGIRRCGKSTLLKQIINQMKNYYYFNFEDQRCLNFEVTDFEKLNEVFNELYGKSDYYFMDEIQNISGWERYVRKMQDQGKKFFITGSNASLLSKELGTKLTGRHITKELFPFSYKEMLKFTNQKAALSSFESYLKRGGFPDYLKYKKDEILQEVFKDILLRDIVVRYGLRNSKLISRLAEYLTTNSGKEFSYNKLKKYFNFGSTNSVISYISYFEESYLMFTVQKFDYSMKRQMVNPKKIYPIDTGLARVNSVSFTKDKGRMLENVVFIALKEKNQEIFYFKGKGECDFLVKDKEKIIQAIQVCYELNEDNKERETAGLREAMKKFNLRKGTILTMNQEDKLDGIEIVPVWKWLD
ncbi:MAG: ATP-binding protein [Nanoarchaeota archaeon]